MHSVIQSAPSLRDRRIADTSRALKAAARRATADRGLSGFTIDELCAEVGIARRTFFNYFASKENAVLGLPIRADLSELDEPFVAAGPSPDSATMIASIAELLLARWEQMELSASDASEIGPAIQREPQLIGHLMELAAQGERHDIGLVERREGLTEGDVRAATAVHLLGALLRPSSIEYFQDTGEEFRTIYLRRLALARELFTA